MRPCGDHIGDCERGGVPPVNLPLVHGAGFIAISIKLSIAIEFVVIACGHGHPAMSGEYIKPKFEL